MHMHIDHITILKDMIFVGFRDHRRSLVAKNVYAMPYHDLYSDSNHLDMILDQLLKYSFQNIASFRIIAVEKLSLL